MKLAKKLTFIVLLVAVLPWLCACDSDEITTVSLAGKINGQDWFMKFGKSTIEANDPGYFALFISTEEEEINPCNVFLPSTRFVSATIPKTPGYDILPFPVANQFTFRFNGQFLIPTNGHVEIKSVEGNFIRGNLFAEADDNNYIAGDFIMQICPND